MGIYHLSTHVINHLSGGDRKFLSVELLTQVVNLVSQHLDKVNPNKTHQVAVVLGEYSKPVKIGNTYGSRIIIAVDVRKRTVCSIFARHICQGKPKACQIMIDLEGNVVS